MDEPVVVNTFEEFLALATPEPDGTIRGTYPDGRSFVYSMGENGEATMELLGDWSRHISLDLTREG